MDISMVMNYRNMRYLFAFLLLAVSVYFASNLVLFFMNLSLVRYSPAGVETPEPLPRKAASLPLEREYTFLLERNLFGIKTHEGAGAKEVDPMPHIDKLALTSLNCTLVGTVIHESGDSWAIIRDNQNKREEKVSVGSVFSGAKVVMILRNKVVLNFNGRDELLVMGIEKIRAHGLAREKGDRESPPEEEGSAYKISRDFIGNNMNDVAKIMATVRIKPFMKEGKPLGFQISHLKEGSPLATMGFKDLDVVTGINGQDVRSPEDAIRLYSTLKDSNFFSVTVVRNNQPITLNYRVW